MFNIVVQLEPHREKYYNLKPIPIFFIYKTASYITDPLTL
jgi:hypothetical protein